MEDKKYLILGGVIYKAQEVDTAEANVLAMSNGVLKVEDFTNTCARCIITVDNCNKVKEKVFL